MSYAEKRELFGEYVEHFRKGEIGPQTFRGRCMELGIDREDVDAALTKHGAENVRNWRART